MRRRLRMVQVTHLDGPGGGPRSLVRHMLFYLAEFDSVILHGGSGLIAKMCDRVGIPHRQLFLDKKRWLGIGFIQLIRWFWKIRPDVVILHGQWAGPVGALAARLAGIRNVLYVVQWPAFYTDWDPLRILRNFYSEKIPCRLAARVITLCEGPRYQFLYRGLCPPEKILSIPNPLSHAVLPTPEERGAVRERWGWGGKEIHVVSVGRLVDQKRVDWLIRAWREVAREGIQARLWIVGDGPERAGLERLSEELGLGGQIRFLGEQKNGWAFLAAADIAVMTTAYEGLGNVVPEALAAGVPVVVSDADGPRDVVTEGREGFLVPPGDIAGMAARILQLARDPELRARMGREGKRKAEEFDGNRILRQYVSVIEDLAFSPSAGRG